MNQLVHEVADLMLEQREGYCVGVHVAAGYLEVILAFQLLLYLFSLLSSLETDKILAVGRHALRWLDIGESLSILVGQENWFLAVASRV